MADPRFQFRLERVREIRERFEEQARENLAASLLDQREGEARVRAANERLAEARSAQRSGTSAGGAVSGVELLARQTFLERTEHDVQAAALDLDRREAEVDARRTALIAASRERQVLERLKERQQAEHALVAARIEGAALDEMALAVHHRREHV